MEREYNMIKIKNKKWLIIFSILTICWICVIFSFSLQPADVSSEMSSGLGKMLLETFVPELLEELGNMSGEQLGLMHHLLRKCAHFAEYFGLGVLVMITLLQTILKKKIAMGIGLSMLVATVDETIQRFVPGRSGQVTDVLLDTVGASVGIFVVYVVMQWLCFKVEEGIKSVKNHINKIQNYE